MAGQCQCEMDSQAQDIVLRAGCARRSRPIASALRGCDKPTQGQTGASSSAGNYMSLHLVPVRPVGTEHMHVTRPGILVKIASMQLLCYTKRISLFAHLYNQD